MADCNLSNPSRTCHTSTAHKYTPIPTRLNENAGLIVEVMSVLSMGLARAEEAAALAWKGLTTVYPRGFGTGYSHLGGVVEALRRSEAL